MDITVHGPIMDTVLEGIVEVSGLVVVGIAAVAAEADTMVEEEGMEEAVAINMESTTDRVS
jgi:hypothetical protein